MNENIQSIIDCILELPPHKDIKFNRKEIPHPRKMGFRRSWGKFRGQIADYRFELEDGKCIHAQDFWRIWLIHWDKVDPKKGFLKHFKADAREYYDLTLFLFGLTIGALTTGSSYFLIESKKKKE